MLSLIATAEGFTFEIVDVNDVLDTTGMSYTEILEACFNGVKPLGHMMITHWSKNEARLNVCDACHARLTPHACAAHHA